MQDRGTDIARSKGKPKKGHSEPCKDWHGVISESTSTQSKEITAEQQTRWTPPIWERPGAGHSGGEFQRKISKEKVAAGETKRLLYGTPFPFKKVTTERPLQDGTCRTESSDRK